MAERKARGTIRVHKGTLELSAYAGVDAAGQKERIYDYLPADAPEHAVEVAMTALVAKADRMIAARRERKENPYAADPVPSADPRRTVTDALEAWWSAHGVHLDGGQGERRAIDNYLIPGLGTVELWRLRRTVTPDMPAAADLVDLTKFFTDLRPITKTEFRPDTVRLIRNVLHGALAREIGAGGLESNPAAHIKLPGGDDRESTTPEPEQMAAFFEFLSTRRVLPARKVTRRVARSEETVTYELPERTIDEDLEAMVRAYARAVMAGPRPQEVSALRRGNYDPATGRLKMLAEGIVWVKKNGEAGEWVHRRGATVKRRKRTIVLDAGARADMATMMAQQDKLAAACGTTLDRRSYLFTDDPDGSGWINPQVASRNFNRAVQRARAAGVDIPKDMRLYDCRHFGISRLVKARPGEIPKIALRYATSAEMIYRVYAHGSDDDDLADDLGGWG